MKALVLSMVAVMALSGCAYFGGKKGCCHSSGCEQRECSMDKKGECKGECPTSKAGKKCDGSECSTDKK